jgi:integrase/recombinase XerD
VQVRRADNRYVNGENNLGLIRDFGSYLRVEKGLRPLTCEAYLSDLRIFAEFLEGRNALLLTACEADVAGLLEHLRNHGIDARSAARKLSCLRGFYKWLLLDRRIHHDPTVNIESPKAWKVLPKSLAEPEVTEMLERAALKASHPQAKATALRDCAILELLYAGGLRVSEVVSLATSDLALDAGRVHVRGKGDKERIVPLGRSAILALEQYLREGRPHLERISSARRGRTRMTTPRQERAWMFLSLRGMPDAAMGVAAGEGRQPLHEPAWFASQLRHAHGGARRGPAQRADSPWPRRHLHHAGLHAPGAGTAEGCASQVPSARHEPSGRDGGG